MEPREKPLGLRILTIYYGVMVLVALGTLALPNFSKIWSAIWVVYFLVMAALAYRDVSWLIVGVITGGILLGIDLYQTAGQVRFMEIGNGGIIALFVLVRLVIFYSLFRYVLEDTVKRRGGKMPKLFDEFFN